MQAGQTVEVVAGDLLYLPPHVAHDGVDTGNWLLHNLLGRLPRSIIRKSRMALTGWGRPAKLKAGFPTPRFTSDYNPARVPKQYQRQIADAIAALQIDRDAIAQFCRMFLPPIRSRSSGKATPRTPQCRAAPSATSARTDANKVALRWQRVRSVCDDKYSFINGDAFVVQGDSAFLASVCP